MVKQETEISPEGNDFGSQDLIVLVGFLRRWQKLLFFCVGLGIALAVIATLVKTPTYSARVSILPQSSETGQMGILGGLALQAGLSMGTSGSHEDVYVEFLKSRRLILPLLYRTWPSAELGKDANLFEVFGFDWVEGDTIAKPVVRARLLKTMKQRVIHFHRDPVTGFMILEVTIDRDPVLAAKLANTMVRSLETYIREVSTNKAMERRVQLEERLWEIQRELGDAESSLVNFELENRNYQMSPKLAEKYRRLHRVVLANEIMWNELKRQVEIARVEENRSLVSIDVLDFAEAPVDSDSPGLVLNLIIGILAGCLIWVLIVLVVGMRNRIQLLNELSSQSG